MEKGDYRQFRERQFREIGSGLLGSKRNNNENVKIIYIYCLNLADKGSIKTLNSKKVWKPATKVSKIEFCKNLLSVVDVQKNFTIMKASRNLQNILTICWVTLFPNFSHNY